MPKHPTSIRMSNKTREQIADIGEPVSEVITRAVDNLHRRETTGDEWVGSGAWRGWRITTSHAASSYGQPVLVRPDGVALGPGDIA